MDVLLVGSDRRSDPGEGVAGQRADAIVLVHLDPGGPPPYALSIPRDTWVTLPDGPPGRIDTALDGAGGGGPGRLVATVTANFGVPVDHYVELDLAGLVGVVDALGGVDLFSDFPSRDRSAGLDIGAGCLHLGGDQALAYVRARHLEQFVDGQWVADPTSDLGRIRRQQELLRRLGAAVADRIRHDPLAADEITKALLPFLTVDPGLDLPTVVDLLGRLADADPTAAQLRTLPVHDATIGGAAVLTWDTTEAAPFLTPFTGAAVAPATDPVPPGSGPAAPPPPC
jgi:LCP family protein required for cell wall assembly